jgi:hypothetical protein
MHHRRLRRRLIAAGVQAALVATAAVTAVALGPSSSLQAAPASGELPSGAQRRLAQLRQALPGPLGMVEEGPAAAADAEFTERAFPDDTISVAEMNGARAAFTQTSNNPFPRNRAKPGTWASVGPSVALYPFTERRGSFNYVPNEYVAGGRTTSLVISPTCEPGNCRMWITAAGGGVWRAKKAAAGQPHWEYLGGPLGINAAGEIALDPNDPTGNTIYVGTGESNICGSGCVAGVGIYKSTNGGDTWTGPLGKAEFQGKGVGDIVVKPGDPNTIYAGSTTALGGMTSVCCTGVTRPIPGIAKWGLYKSTDGGASWSFMHNGAATTAACTGDLTEFTNGGVCSPRGVRHVRLDPTNPDIVYASSYARGVWRSSDGGATWVQIKPSINAAVIQSRAAIDVTTLASGATRMYVHEGNAGQNSSRLFRSDSVATGVPVFTDMSSPTTADPGWAFRGLCDPQCWYDIFVHTPKGHPDVVYVGGDYSYGETIANKRGVILSTDAGMTGTDMTFDATDPIHPNGIHPDQHDLVVNPNNPFEFLEAGDGGVIRSNGRFSNVSSWCASRGLSAQNLARCEQMLSRVPTKLTSLNKGLSTLQFQSLSVSPFDVRELQGGTQDNGTWENYGSPVTWQNTIIGDGGQSGFDVAIPELRFHNYTNATTEVNFNNGDVDDWIWVADPIAHGGEFYAPVISDPVVSKTMFAGTSRTVYRTKTAGLGTMTMAEAQQHCNTWDGDFAVTCGDWEELGAVRLLLPAWGDRAGGNMAAIERTKADTSSAWAATTTGRVFISKNVDADPASAVSWTRIDDDATIDPNRFVSSIYIDPADGNHAWVSYSGFGVNTPGTPGHVFEVTYDQTTGTSSWVDRSYDFGDLPATDLVRDDVTGDLYAGSDFGVSRLAAGATTWTLAAPGMPNVEITGLTIVPQARRLYAASHGLSAWVLILAD